MTKVFTIHPAGGVLIAVEMYHETLNIATSWWRKRKGQGIIKVAKIYRLGIRKRKLMTYASNSCGHVSVWIDQTVEKLS